MPNDDIVFSTDADTPKAVVRERRGIAQWLVGKGLVRTERQAQYMMVIVAVLAGLLAILVWPQGGANQPVEGPGNPLSMRTL